MRLNWFVPTLSRTRQGGEPPRPGSVRRLLRFLGPSWLYSPVHRFSQAACLILFLVLFFYTCSAPPGAVQKREFADAELFLALDPLVGISTAIAARAWTRSLAWAAAVLAACLLVPRGFCGYVCPLGTLTDLFDWAAGRRVKLLRVERDGWFVNLKYYVLAAVLAAAVLGVALSGFVSAIPILTRGLLHTAAPVQTGVLEGWGRVPPLHVANYVSIALLISVLALGLLRQRFWCRYVCPTGAVLSAANFLRLTERKVESSCTRCGRCVEVCPFDAINADFSTRPADCTFCQVCGGVCPVHAINFVPRWRGRDREPTGEHVADNVPLSRRGLLGGLILGTGAALGLRKLPAFSTIAPPVRPPGSVPEDKFLAMCVRCGECMNACPTKVLQPASARYGLESLWTPCAEANWAACDPECNNCGQVCPTGAIRALSLDEKRAAHMGLAVVNEDTCIMCDVCVSACPYDAIYWVPGSLPRVNRYQCNGCGACQEKCYRVNVERTAQLVLSAIVVEAGPGKDDRMTAGSYVELRERERREVPPEQHEPQQEPDFLEGLF